MKTFTQNEIVRNLHRLVFLMDKIADHLLRKKLYLTFSQFRILIVVGKIKNVTQAEVAKFLDLSPAAISRQIELLAAKKLLKVSANAKVRRENILALTSKGHKQLEKAMDIMSGSFNRIYKILGKSEQKNTSTAVAKLVGFIHNKGTEYFCNPKNLS